MYCHFAYLADCSLCIFSNKVHTPFSSGPGTEALLRSWVRHYDYAWKVLTHVFFFRHSSSKKMPIMRIHFFIIYPTNRIDSLRRIGCIVRIILAPQAYTLILNILNVKTCIFFAAELIRSWQLCLDNDVTDNKAKTLGI